MRWRSFVAEIVARGRGTGHHHGGHPRRAARRHPAHPPGPGHRLVVRQGLRRAVRPVDARATRGRPGSPGCCRTRACRRASRRSRSGPPSRTTSPSRPRPKATIALLQRVEEVLDVEVPLGALPEQAEKWERTVSEMADEDDEVARVRQGPRGGRGRRERPHRGQRRGDRRRLRALPAPPRPGQRAGGPAAWRAARTSAVPGSAELAHPGSEGSGFLPLRCKHRPLLACVGRPRGGSAQGPRRVQLQSGPARQQPHDAARCRSRRAQPEGRRRAHPGHREHPPDGVDDDPARRVRRLPRPHRDHVGPGPAIRTASTARGPGIVGSEAGVGGTGVGSAPATVIPVGTPGAADGRAHTTGASSAASRRGNARG